MNAPAVQRPQRQDFQPIEEAKSINSLLQRPDIRARMAQILPRHLSPDRMLRVCALAIHKTPKLLECDPVTLLGALMACGSFGLEPNTPLGHAYLIPFERRGNVNGKWQTISVDVQLIIGYRGYIDLARRSGSLVSIHADVVYEGDEFSFEYGSNTHLRHVPKGDREGRRAVWAYAHAQLTDGQAFEVLPYERVLKIRDSSQGWITAKRHGKEAETPWGRFEHEMASKTMIRRLAKYLPMAIENPTLAQAVTVDGMSEAGRIDFGSFVRNPEAFEDPEIAATDAPAQVEHKPEPVVTTMTAARPAAEPQSSAEVQAAERAMDAEYAAALGGRIPFSDEDFAQEAEHATPEQTVTEQQPQETVQQKAQSSKSSMKATGKPDLPMPAQLDLEASDAAVSFYAKEVSQYVRNARQGQQIEDLLAVHNESLKLLRALDGDAYRSVDLLIQNRLADFS